MKKILIFCIALWMVSCDYSETDLTITYLKSYITHYLDTRWYAKTRNDGLWPLENKAAINLDMRRLVNEIYYAPEVGGKGENAARFLEIAERNGDRSYNRNDGNLSYMHRECNMNNYRRIQVVCTNAAWDKDHPAGTPLDDLVTVHLCTFGPFVHAGYKGDDYTWILKFLPQLTTDDLEMLTESISLFFDRHPETGIYEMEVTLTTTEGEEETATCTFDFE